MTYNGHKNYETFVVADWLSNNQPDYSNWLGVAIDILKSGDEYPIVELASRLQNAAESSKPSGVEFWDVLINAALIEVDWCEIAEKFIDVAKEEIE